MIMRAIWTRLAPGIATLALTLASGAANADDCNLPSDFVTGGGFIIIPTATGTSTHANFGVAGGCKNGSFFGHLEYVDHGSVLAPPSAPTPFTVHWTSITAYQFDSSGGFDSHGRPLGSRFICGKARTNLPFPNDNDVDFAVRANDTGEPGVTDEFDIQLTKGGFLVYTTNPNFAPGGAHRLNDGLGGGGNIQLHGTAGGSDGSCPARVAGDIA
jgi:hypothetical protein